MSMPSSRWRSSSRVAAAPSSLVTLLVFAHLLHCFGSGHGVLSIKHLQQVVMRIDARLSAHSPWSRDCARAPTWRGHGPSRTGTHSHLACCTAHLSMPSVSAEQLTALATLWTSSESGTDLRTGTTCVGAPSRELAWTTKVVRELRIELGHAPSTLVVGSQE